MTTLSIPPISALIRDGVFSIDNSRMALIRQCPRKAYYHIALNRVPAREGSELSFGRALHAAQEFRYKKCGSRAIEPAEQAEQEAVLEKAFEEIKVEEDNWQNIGRAKEAIAYWNHEFRGEPFDVLETERGVEIELGSVECPHFRTVGCAVCGVCTGMGILRIRYQARIDALVRYEGKVLLHDYKSCKEQDWKVADARYRMSPQFRGYCEVASTLGYGPVRDFWIDTMIARKPLSRETRQSAPRNEFSRNQYHVTDGEIAEWKRDTLKLIESWLRFCAEGMPPMNLDACTAFFKPCCYFDVCSITGGEAQRMAWLNSSAYKPSTFNPMAK